MKHSGHIKFAYVTFVLMLGACTVYAFVYFFIHRSSADVQASYEKVSVERSYRTQGKDIAGIYESTIESRTQIKSMFTSEKETVSFIESLESLGPQTGSEVTISSIESIPSTDGVNGIVRVRVDSKGSWSAVMKTLMLAESLPYRAVVSKVRIDTSGVIDPKVQREWRVSFVLEAARSDN